MRPNVFADASVEPRVILRIRPAPALIAFAAPLVGGLQARAIHGESGHGEVDDLAHPVPRLRLAGAHGVRISPAESGMCPDDFFKAPAIDAESRVHADALLVRC